MFHKSWMLSATILFTFWPYEQAIKCYQCNSFNDEQCMDLQEKDDVRPQPQDCPGEPDFIPPDKRLAKLEEPFCRKTHIELIENRATVLTRVYRSCGYIKYYKECRKEDGPAKMETVCQCFTDGCNLANIGQSSFPLVTIVTLSLLMFLRHLFLF